MQHTRFDHPVRHRLKPSLLAAAIAFALPLAASAADPIVQSFAAVGASEWTVPTGVTSLDVTAIGAGGGGGQGLNDPNNMVGFGGPGGTVTNTAVPVKAGDVIRVFVGGGGGAAGYLNTAGGYFGGGGGGATTLAVNGQIKMVAGGGGGAAFRSDQPVSGGAGCGNPGAGGDGTNSAGGGGMGGADGTGGVGGTAGVPSPGGGPGQGFAATALKAEGDADNKIGTPGAAGSGGAGGAGDPSAPQSPTDGGQGLGEGDGAGGIGGYVIEGNATTAAGGGGGGYGGGGGGGLGVTNDDKAGGGGGGGYFGGTCAPADNGGNVLPFESTPNRAPAPAGSFSKAMPTALGGDGSVVIRYLVAPVVTPPVTPPVAAAPTPVPGLGVWGIAALTGLLGLAGLRRRRKA